MILPGQEWTRKKPLAGRGREGGREEEDEPVMIYRTIQTKERSRRRRRTRHRANNNSSALDGE